MIERNTAQQILALLGIAYKLDKDLSGKNPSFTKKGPGRKAFKSKR
jgi:hypothetical protein